MENLIPFTLFGSGIIFGIFTLAFIIALFASDVTEEGAGAFVAAIIYGLVIYFWSDFKFLPFLTIKYISIYLTLGFLFSIIRTYFKGLELKKDPEKKKSFDLKEHVFRWWFLFPVALINWVVGQLVADVYNFLYGKVSKFYNLIFTIHDKQIEETK